MNKDEIFHEILTQVICAMINAGEMKVFCYEAKLDKAVQITNSIIEICDKGIYYKENVV
jgi:hypothetical protein